MAIDPDKFGERWAYRENATTLKPVEWTSEIGYVLGTTTDNESHWDVQAYADANGPTTDGTLVRSSIDVEQETARRWSIIYRFAHPDNEASKPQQSPSDPSEFSFNTVGGSIQITNSLQTIDKGLGADAIPAESIYNRKTALNVDPQTGKPSPISIVNGTLGYVEKKVFHPASITCAYVKALRDLTATVNNAPWKCFARGEALFLGATGQQQGTGVWTITFNFSIDVNSTITIPDPVYTDPNQSVAVQKGPHEYFWVSMVDAEDGDPAQQGNLKTIQRPAWYVERIYNEADFSLLGIGV